MLAKKDALRDEIAAVDDAINKQIDKFDAAWDQLGRTLTEEATQTDAHLDTAAKSARLMVLVSIAVGGATI